MPITKVTEEEDFLTSPAFEMVLANDDGLAAKQHLAAGRPIYYGDERYPEGIVKESPNGQRQLVSISNKGVLTFIRNL